MSLTVTTGHILYYWLTIRLFFQEIIADSKDLSLKYGEFKPVSVEKRDI
jgi:hypothetical protein